MTSIAPHFEKLPTHKREMTIQENGIKDIGKKYNIPIRIVSIESNECDERERKQELIEKMKQ
jgi:hypothetical protein